jgi:predicted nucleic acid-binding Zn ribbon protein
MIELTEQQHEELTGNGTPARVLDPATKREYVLVPAADYARLQQLREQAEDDAEQAAWADAVEEAHSEIANELI